MTCQKLYVNISPNGDVIRKKSFPYSVPDPCFVCRQCQRRHRHHLHRLLLRRRRRWRRPQRRC